MKGYMSAREAAYKWGVSESRVHKLCQAGRIPGGGNASDGPGRFLKML